MSSKIFGKKLLALLLATGLCASLAAPAYAVSWSSSSGAGSAFSNFWNLLFGGGQTAAQTEPVSTPTATTAVNTDDIVYYPATLIDYDKDAINQSMANLDVQYARDNNKSTNSSGWVWNGMYFGSGIPRGSLTGTYGATPTYSRESSNPRWQALTSSDGENIGTSYFYQDGVNYYPVTVTRTSTTS